MRRGVIFHMDLIRFSIVSKIKLELNEVSDKKKIISFTL